MIQEDFQPGARGGKTEKIATVGGVGQIVEEHGLVSFNEQYESETSTGKDFTTKVA